MNNNVILETVNKDGNIWFVAKSVCDILEISDIDATLNALNEEQKSTCKVYLTSKEIPIISESGVYSLIGEDSSLEAKTFIKWISYIVQRHTLPTKKTRIQRQPINKATIKVLLLHS